MAIIISFFNFKGGVGKTTSALNVGAGLALKGKKVLMIDLDPQCNLSTSVGVGLEEYDQNGGVVESDQLTLYDVMQQQEVSDLPIIAIKENLWLVPGDINLVETEQTLMVRVAKETVLRKLIEPIKNDYDYIIIDCPPSLGNLTGNGISASDWVIIPAKAEYFSLHGMQKVFMYIELLKENINPNINVIKILLTQLNKRNNIHKLVVEKMKDCYDEYLLDTIIRVNITLSESPANSEDIFAYAPESNGAIDYNSLVSEIEKLNSK